MANFNMTPNMGLPNPVPGIDPGIDYANNLESSLNIIDQHDHSSTSGVQISPDGMYINAPLPFNNNSAISLKSLVFTQQASLATLNAIFVGTDGELYFNDGNSNPSIKMTSGGTVNATSSGISNGTATASFVSSVLVVNSAPNTPANVQGRSFLLGNNVTGGFYLTLSAPALSSNYAITLPALPAAQNIMTIDASGNIASNWNVDGSTITVSSNNLGVPNSGIDTAQLAAGSVTLPKLAAANIAYGAISSSPAGASPVTLATVSLTATGRPVMISLIDDGLNAGFSTITVNGGPSTSFFVIKRDGTTIADTAWVSGATASATMPSGSFSFMDTPSAGVHSYTLVVSSNATINIANMRMMVYEF